jgi:hypothetical protein
MGADELDMRKDTVRKFCIASGHEKVSSEARSVKFHGGTKGQTPHFVKIIFWIMSSLVVKHDVISIIPRKVSPRSEDQTIPPAQRRHRYQSPRQKQC